MPRRLKIERDAMLREFGYDLSTMSENARKSAANRMEKAHSLTRFYMAGKRMRHYWQDQVFAASEPIEA